MYLFPNMKSFFFVKKRCKTPSDNASEKGNGVDWFRRHSSAIKEISRYALQHNLLIIAYYITRLYFLTIRIESVNEGIIRQRLTNGEKAIAALWHQRIIAAIGYAKRFGIYRPSVMISSSRDGDLISSVFSRMNFRPVRGSSSLNGKKALLDMVDDLKNNHFAVHVLDGPKGPKGIIKPGLITMAKQSGVPIVPVYISISRAWTLNSWDHCLIPKPFSKIVIRWDQPLSVPREIDEHNFEEIRLSIEKHMLENQRMEDDRFGRENLI